MKPTKRQWIFQAWIGGGAQESCRPALEGGWISVPNWERGACDQAEMITKRPLGLTFCHSLPGELAQCVVSQDTAASSGSSEEEDTAGWMVCGSLSSPTLFPALPLPPCPAPCLTSRTIPHDRRCSCTAPWCRSYSSSLCSHRRKSVGIARSWHCRSTWSSCPCRDLLI